MLCLPGLLVEEPLLISCPTPFTRVVNHCFRYLILSGVELMSLSTGNLCYFLLFLPDQHEAVIKCSEPEQEQRR